MEEENDNPKFKSLKDKLSKRTLKSIKSMGFKHMTAIQAEVLPKALNGCDVVATAKTGSGKTLAFLIPIVEAVSKQTMENQAPGVHVVVATPGRLFDHMRTKEFDYKHVNCLVLDEADKIFQYGFEEDLKQIIGRLPKKRQTMLFSATEADTTQALIKSAMKEDVQSINTSEDNLRATVKGLKQGCKSVVFHYEFFSKYCQAAVLCIHGKMNQADRTETISNFYNAEKVALFCTDLAARGLDIPAVDWIVQFDPPSDTNEYIHRVGRTARGLGAAGNAVLLLRPEEKEFVDYLHEAKIYLDKFESWNRYYNLQSKLDEAFSDPGFHKLAVDALEGYIRAFEVKKLKHVFNLLTLDLNAAARSFGLKEKPDVDIRVGFSKKHRPRKRKAMQEALTGHISKQLKT
ncbi:hypothetical protein MSG28_008039 [Choristoneura fumiferana]|uniref:Uncharacterized protein n=1 Tax=Choristoneura fumiferana TaxID=7141 RepID=A0ACC0JA13_CHOFU|nr:hypothetical protein MSG28_008039 [Choristoneura fumiferana]